MIYKPSEPAPFENIFVKLVIGFLAAIIILFILTACGSPTGIAEYQAQTESANQIRDIPTQTPYVVVMTATQEPATVEVPTEEPTPICPPEHAAQITVGYIPWLDVGEKKSPVTVSFGCMLLTVDFGEGVYLQGLLSEDGQKLDTCTLYASYPFPCTLELRNPDHLNVRAFYFNKNGERFAICLAKDNKNYIDGCQ